MAVNLRLSAAPMLCWSRTIVRHPIDPGAAGGWLFASTGAPANNDDKVMRLRAQTAKIEGQFALFPEQAHWLDAYLLELTTFPNSKNDDQVDSTANGARLEHAGGNQAGDGSWRRAGSGWANLREYGRRLQ